MSVKNCGDCSQFIQHTEEKETFGCVSTVGEWIDGNADDPVCDFFTPIESDVLPSQEEPESLLAGNDNVQDVPDVPAETETGRTMDAMQREIDHLKLHVESISESHKRLYVLRANMSDAKEKRDAWGKQVKSLQEKIDEAIEEMEEKEYRPENYPLIMVADGETAKKEDVSVDTEAAPIDKDAWRSLLASDHFSFSETEWGLMSPSEGTADKMTVGDLEDFRVRLSREKVSGFGPAKKQKLDDQMEQFWTNHPEFCETMETTDAPQEGEGESKVESEVTSESDATTDSVQADETDNF